MNDIRKTDLTDIPPLSFSQFQTVNSILVGIDKYFKGVWSDIETLSFFSRIDKLEEPLLIHLAYYLRVDFWKDSDSVQVKRDLIRNSIKWHKIKGTPYAVRKLLDIVLNGQARVTEWFKYGGLPYHFQIKLHFTEDVSKGLFPRAIELINRSKNTRSVLDKITAEHTTNGTVNAGAVTYIKQEFFFTQEN